MLGQVWTKIRSMCYSFLFPLKIFTSCCITKESLGFMMNYGKLKVKWMYVGRWSDLGQVLHHSFFGITLLLFMPSRDTLLVLSNTLYTSSVSFLNATLWLLYYSYANFNHILLLIYKYKCYHARCWICLNVYLLNINFEQF